MGKLGWGILSVMFAALSACDEASLQEPRDPSATIADPDTGVLITLPEIAVPANAAQIVFDRDLEPESLEDNLEGIYTGSASEAFGGGETAKIAAFVEFALDEYRREYASLVAGDEMGDAEVPAP